MLSRMRRSFLVPVLAFLALFSFAQEELKIGWMMKVTTSNANDVHAQQVAMEWALNQTRPLLLAQGWNPSLHIYRWGNSSDLWSAAARKVVVLPNLTAVIGAYSSWSTLAIHPGRTRNAG